MDDDKDPNDSLMDLMKKMYDEGDDDMKRTIAQAWTQSKDKKSVPWLGQTSLPNRPKLVGMSIKLLSFYEDETLLVIIHPCHRVHVSLCDKWLFYYMCITVDS